MLEGPPRAWGRQSKDLTATSALPEEAECRVLREAVLRAGSQSQLCLYYLGDFEQALHLSELPRLHW